MLKKVDGRVVFVPDKYTNNFTPAPRPLTPTQADPAHGLNLLRLKKKEVGLRTFCPKS